MKKSKMKKEYPLPDYMDIKSIFAGIFDNSYPLIHGFPKMDVTIDSKEESNGSPAMKLINSVTKLEFEPHQTGK